MNKIKVILIISFAIFVFICIGVFVFLKTLDINNYKETIASKIGSSIGRDVTIKNVSFKSSLAQGVSLSISSLNVQGHPEFTDDSLFYVDSARLNIDIVTLILKRQIFISTIEFDSPRINIVKNSDGELNIQHLSQNQESKGALDSADNKKMELAEANKRSESSSVAFGDFLIRSIDISDGTVVYTDRSSDKTITVPVSKVDIKITNLSFNSEVPFKASARLWSQDTNITVSGMANIKANNKQLRIDDLKIKTDLAQLSFDLAKKDITSIGEAVLPGSLGGVLEINLQQLIMGEEGLLVLSSEGRLDDGYAKFKEFPVPLTEMNLKFDITDSGIEIRQSSLALASGTVTVNGRIVDYLKDQNFSFELDTSGIRLNELITPFDVPFDVEGEVAIKHTIKGEGFSNEAISKNLSGEGTSAINDGKVLNVNILRIVLSKISFIPNLSTVVEENLPEKYKDKLKQKDTILEEVSVSTSIRQGALNIDEAIVNADGFKAIGQGKIDFSQQMFFRADVLIPKELTESLIKAAPEMEYLLNENGQILIPLKPYEGPLANFRMLPDVSHVSSEIIRNRGKDELKKVIFEALDIEQQAPAESAPEDGAEPAPQEARPEEVIIENILNNIPIFQ